MLQEMGAPISKTVRYNTKAAGIIPVCSRMTDTGRRSK
jgi:hypothetical protein